MAGFIIILSLVAILTVEGRSSRENELNQALSAAVEETMTNLCTTKKYTIGSQEEFVADFARRCWNGCMRAAEMRRMIISRSRWM